MTLLDISQPRACAETVFPDIVEDNDESSSDSPEEVADQPAPQLHWSSHDHPPPERFM